MAQMQFVTPVEQAQTTIIQPSAQTGVQQQHVVCLVPANMVQPGMQPVDPQHFFAASPHEDVSNPNVSQGNGLRTRERDDPFKGAHWRMRDQSPSRRGRDSPKLGSPKLGSPRRVQTDTVIPLRVGSPVGSPGSPVRVSSPKSRPNHFRSTSPKNGPNQFRSDSPRNGSKNHVPQSNSELPFNSKWKDSAERQGRRIEYHYGEGAWSRWGYNLDDLDQELDVWMADRMGKRRQAYRNVCDSWCYTEDRYSNGTLHRFTTGWRSPESSWWGSHWRPAWQKPAWNTQRSQQLSQLTENALQSRSDVQAPVDTRKNSESTAESFAASSSGLSDAEAEEPVVQPDVTSLSCMQDHTVLEKEDPPSDAQQEEAEKQIDSEVVDKEKTEKAKAKVEERANSVLSRLFQKGREAVEKTLSDGLQ